MASDTAQEIMSHYTQARTPQSVIDHLEVETQITQHRSYYLITAYDKNNQELGYTAFTILPDQKGAWIHNINAKTPHQHVGGDLLNLLEYKCFLAGVQTIKGRLVTLAPNPKEIVGFYKHYGYETKKNYGSERNQDLKKTLNHCILPSSKLLHMLNSASTTEYGKNRSPSWELPSYVTFAPEQTKTQP